MSELLSAVAATLGAPEALIQRSVDARAAAQGIDAEQVLEAWASGSAFSVAAPEAPKAAPAVVPESAVPAPVDAVEDDGDEVSEPATAAPAEALQPVATALPAFEPAPLGSRLRLPAALGAGAGGFFGLITAGLAAVFLVDNAAAVEQGTGFRAVVQVEILPIVIATALLAAVFGGFLGILGRRGPAFFRPELAVVGGSGIWFGALIGLALGAIGGGVLAGALGMETIDEGIVAIPVVTALWWLVIGGAGLGAGTAVLAHVTAVPAGFSAGESADSGEVRTRLTQSMLLPLVSVLVLAGVIALIATLFLLFHEAASALAIVISAGILLFAFLGGYRPSIKLRYTEVVAALAGIATVVVAIVLVVVVRGE
ncbi:MAG: hypothetical protein P1T08_08155 [Acidimicrobiia bacterium]|nr:hypothetical protein [Acidimicrobiia bacterium]